MQVSNKIRNFFVVIFSALILCAFVGGIYLVGYTVRDYQLLDECEKDCDENCQYIKEDFEQGKEFILWDTYKVYPIKGHKNRWHYIPISEWKGMDFGLVITLQDKYEW